MDDDIQPIEEENDSDTENATEETREKKPKLRASGFLKS